MKNIYYFVSGLIFSFGLLISGMADPQKIKTFLQVNSSTWSPALMVVLMVAVFVYLLAFTLIRKRGSTLLGANFSRPQVRPVDRKLLLGSAIFGLGWGLVGLCPGPALVNLASPGPSLLLFVGCMIVGFELQRRFS